jgi:hypothetical protein
MDEDEQQEDVNPLFGGVENVNNNTIENMFDLSAYLSDNKDKLTFVVTRSYLFQEPKAVLMENHSRMCRSTPRQ